MSTDQRISNLKEMAFIQPTRKDSHDTRSDLRFCKWIWSGMLGLALAESPSRLSASARKVALAVLSSLIGISLCLGLTPVAHAPSAKALALDVKSYASIKVNNKSEFKCLNKLWSLESNWNHKAFNRSGAYGIPQIKNIRIKSMDKYEQVDAGLKYLKHRYPSICYALGKWNVRAGGDWIGGWY